MNFNRKIDDLLSPESWENEARMPENSLMCSEQIFLSELADSEDDTLFGKDTYYIPSKAI